MDKPSSTVCPIGELSPQSQDFLACHERRAKGVLVELDIAAINEYIMGFFIETAKQKEMTGEIFNPWNPLNRKLIEKLYLIKKSK